MKKRIIYTIFIGIIVFLSGCGSRIPSEKDIELDISENVTVVPVENPFTGLIEYQELEITRFEIDKSQTTDSRYRAYCIIDMENDFYEYTKYIVCNYTKYDGNKWELNDYNEYHDAEFVVVENPFTEADVYRMVASTYYSKDAEVKEVNFALDENIVWCQYVYDKNYKYKLTSTRETRWYSFNGSYWEQIDSASSSSNSWNIIGSWKLMNGPDGAAFDLTIDSFDSNNLTGSGYCKFGYTSRYYSLKNTNTYRIEEAKIVETDNGNLIIMFDGNVDSIILGWGSDEFIGITGEEARAYYGSYWREEIELCSTETASIDIIEYILMPDVVGKTVEDARNALNSQGLRSQSVYEESDVVDVGVVMRADVESGTEIPKGTLVTLTASAGPRGIEIPSVVNQSYEEAEETLKNQGFNVIRMEGYSDTVAAGIVVSQVPAALDKAPAGATITLTVSLGPQSNTVKMPNLIGKSEVEGRILLKESGLACNRVVYEYNSEYAEGVIFWQQYSAGQDVTLGTGINLKVSKGP